MNLHDPFLKNNLFYIILEYQNYELNLKSIPFYLAESLRIFNGNKKMACIFYKEVESDGNCMCNNK
jgi:hypothetical protein